MKTFHFSGRLGSSRGNTMVKGNTVFGILLYKKVYVVMMGRRWVGDRMGREDSGDFVIYCSREVRWAGP